MALASKLTLQNAAAVALLPGYLLLRIFLRIFGILKPGFRGPWVCGGHSGRLYADNAAAVHASLQAAGREVYFVVSDSGVAGQLVQRGVRVLRRNSIRARIAIENAEALVYSHGVSDLDHVLARAVGLRGLKVHLNHCMNHLKAGQLAQPRYAALPESERVRIAARLDPFDYLLASSERERANFVRGFPGRASQIRLGGGAHLDAFMRARAARPGRSIVYVPTFREHEAARERLEAVIDELVGQPALLAFLEREDLVLQVVAHVNRSGRTRETSHARVVFVPPTELERCILDSHTFISDYSGLLCDQLALGRPTVFFPFDAEDYLRGRSLFVPYDELAWGPIARDVAQLVDILCSGRARDLAPYAERRAHWEAEFFPRFTPDYAERSVATIERLLQERSGAARG